MDLKQRTAGDPYDGFVMKIMPLGNGPGDLSYGTYLGGLGSDQALAITVGGQFPGVAYVPGRTQSTNFPVTGSMSRIDRGISNDVKRKRQCVRRGDWAERGGRSISSLLQLSRGSAIRHGTERLVRATQPNISWLEARPRRISRRNIIFSRSQVTRMHLSTELDPTSQGSASLIYSTSLGGTSRLA